MSAPRKDAHESTWVDWDATSFDEPLRAHGLRSTRARRLVLAVLSALPDHPTVEQIGRRLESAGTPVAPPTLYQTLSRLCQAGLLSSFVDANGRLRFDTNLAFHHHVRCLECGLILDVSVGEQEEELEGLATTANKHLPEWEVATVRLELQGICPSCLVAGGGRSRCRNS